MIVALRTDAMVIELYGYNDGQLAQELRQEVGRDMARLLPGVIEDFMKDEPVDGLIVFRGPGSFTGLRIGITVVNTIAFARDIPVVGTMTEQWVEQGLQRLASGENDRIVLPEYGAAPNITRPRK